MEEYMLSFSQFCISFYLLFKQLRSFCIDYAEACGHFATAVKLIEQEINEKGPSRILDEKLIQVSTCMSVSIIIRNTKYRRFSFSCLILIKKMHTKCNFV